MSEIPQQNDDVPDVADDPSDPEWYDDNPAAESDDGGEPAEQLQPTEPPPGPALALLALLLPVLAGAAEGFLPDTLGLALALVTVLLTAGLLAIDAGRLARWNPAEERTGSPTRTLLGLLLFWVVWYPLTYFRRSAICGPDMRGAAVGAMLAFLFLPTVIPVLLKPPELPACDASEVLELIQQLAAREFPGRKIGQVEDPREVSCDPLLQQRRGSCMVRVDGERIPVPFLIQWQDHEQAVFSVSLLLLPQADSPQIIEIIEQQARTALSEFRIEQVDSYREVAFDEQTQRRRCVCVAHSETTEIPVPFVVQWHDKTMQEFEVQSFVLPGPTSEDVVKLVEDFLKQAFEDQEVTSIDGYRELRADWEAGERFGACRVHIGDEEVEVRFKVKWKDQFEGVFALELIDEDAV